MALAALPDAAGSGGFDRGRVLLLVVATLAFVGALFGPLFSSVGGVEPAPCPNARVDGLRVMCGEAAPSAGVEAGGEPGARVWLLGEKLDLNRASAQDLARISGVGKGLARAIVAERERRGGFDSLADLEDVRGVGPAKRRLLERFVKLSEAPR